MSITNNELKRKIIEISYKHKLSHLGSCLTAVDIIQKIYDVKEDNEKFVLSQGHAGLALYVVLEKYLVQKGFAEYAINEIGIHPDRSLKPIATTSLHSQSPIDCSAGSLGHGLPIALGMALADRTKNVYCLISDGELAEGSMWEALRIAREQRVDNLKIFANFNGYAGYRQMNAKYLINMIKANEFPVEIVHTNVTDYPFLNGIDAHYYVMNENDYQVALKILR